MNINKQVALGMLIINAAYLTVSTFLFFYLHNTIILDFTKPPPIHKSFSTGLVLMILNMIIYTGLIWVLWVFNEKMWIRAGLVIILLLKILIAITIASLENMGGLFDIFRFGTTTIMILVLLSLFFLTSVTVKIYYRLFSIFMAIAFLMPSISGYLYDNFGIGWLLISQDALFIPGFVITLLLFLKVYRLLLTEDRSAISQ